MSEQQKKPFKDRAQPEPRPLRIALPASEVRGEKTSSRSPWGIGSSVYPCSADVLRNTTNTLLPMGRQWLRSAFDKCMGAQETEALAQVIVPNTLPKLDQKALLKKRKATQTCWEAHPGLCTKDPNFTSIVACHEGVNRAVRSFCIPPGDGDGQAMFLFVGCKRKREADAVQHRNVVDGIKGDEFELAILSDQPDRRRGFKTWSVCRFTVAEHTFQLPSHVGLTQTDTLTFSECVSFEFAKRLRDRAKYWVLFYLVYDDLEDDLRTMKAW